MVNRMKPNISPRFEDMGRDEQIACSQAAKLLVDAFGVDELDALQWIVNAIDFRAKTKAAFGCNRCGIIAFNCSAKKQQHNNEMHGTTGRKRRQIAERLADDVEVCVQRSDHDARDRVLDVPRGFPLGHAILRPYKGGG